VVSDPSLAHAHKAGSKGVVMQLSEHARLGTVALRWPRYWALHHQSAIASFRALERVHASIAAMPADKTDMRRLYDMRTVAALYRAGCGFVMNAAVAAQQLACEMEREAHASVGVGSVEVRLKIVGRKVGILNVVKGAGYEHFNELLLIRNAVEHPKPHNIYNGNDWSKVPLAWFASDRAMVAGYGFFEWFDGVVDAWNAVMPKFASGPVTFDIERGIRSRRQAAKPR
jgi:hypothetical protein